MKELMTVLKDERAEVRKYAAEALGNIGPAARDAFSALEDAEGDPDADVRIAAGPRASEREVPRVLALRDYVSICSIH
jgi:HEAT repeat protein